MWADLGQEEATPKVLWEFRGGSSQGGRRLEGFPEEVAFELGAERKIVVLWVQSREKKTF